MEKAISKESGIALARNVTELYPHGMAPVDLEPNKPEQIQYRHDTTDRTGTCSPTPFLVVSGETLCRQKEKHAGSAMNARERGAEITEDSRTYSVLSRDLLADPMVPLLHPTTGEDGHCTRAPGGTGTESVEAAA